MKFFIVYSLVTFTKVLSGSKKISDPKIIMNKKTLLQVPQQIYFGKCFNDYKNKHNWT